MDFDRLKNIRQLDEVLDTSIQRLKKKLSQYKSTLKIANYINRIKAIQDFKIKHVTQSLVDYCDSILENFPSLDSLHEYYYQLINLELDYDKLKKSLGAVNWIKTQTRKINRDIIQRLNAAKDREKINHQYKAFLGRFSSINRQTRDEFEYLEHCRRVMKKFPSIRTKMFTVCISGFPNVGKSTLLAKLTQSVPDIQNYSFTTKKINAGYMKTLYDDIQVIDTPGTLARDKMNQVELHAHLALKYLASKILFVFDLTQTAYSLEDQWKLLDLNEDYDKDIFVYVTKQDLLKAEEIEKFREEFSKRSKYKLITDFDELKTHIIEEVKEYIR